MRIYLEFLMFLQSVVGSRTPLPSASHVTFHTRVSRHSYMALAMPPVIYRTELSRGGVERCFLSAWHQLYLTAIIYSEKSRASSCNHPRNFFSWLQYIQALQCTMVTIMSVLLRLNMSNSTRLLPYLPSSTKQNGHEYGIDEHFGSKSFTVSGNTAISIVTWMCK